MTTITTTLSGLRALRLHHPVDWAGSSQALSSPPHLRASPSLQPSSLLHPPALPSPPPPSPPPAGGRGTGGSGAGGSCWHEYWVLPCRSAQPRNARQTVRPQQVGLQRRILTRILYWWLLDRSMYNNSTGTYVPFQNDEDYYLTNSKSQVGYNDDLGWSLSISSLERWKSRWKFEIKPKCHLRNKYNSRNINIIGRNSLFLFMKSRNANLSSSPGVLGPCWPVHRSVLCVLPPGDAGSSSSSLVGWGGQVRRMGRPGLSAVSKWDEGGNCDVYCSDVRRGPSSPAHQLTTIYTRIVWRNTSRSQSTWSPNYWLSRTLIVCCCLQG